MHSFLGIPPTPELVSKVLQMASLEFMTDPLHARKFDDHMIYDKQIQLGRAGYMLNPPASKVLLKPKTLNGSSKFDISAATKEHMASQWQKLVACKVGFQNYKEMADAIASEQS